MEMWTQWARGAQLPQCCCQPAALTSGWGAQSRDLVAILVIRPTARGALLLAVAGGPDVVDGMWVLQAVVVVDVDVDGSLVACCLSPWLGGCCVPSYKN